MARSPIGYVEVWPKRSTLDQEASVQWVRLIWAQELMDWSDCYPFARLFGVSAVGCNCLQGVEPIAADRGLPRDLSLELRFEVLEADEQGCIPYGELAGAELLHSDYYGHAWVTWREIAQLDTTHIATSGWKTLISLMDTLAGAYGQDGVRLVFWMSR